MFTTGLSSYELDLNFVIARHFPQGIPVNTRKYLFNLANICYESAICQQHTGLRNIPTL